MRQDIVNRKTGETDIINTIVYATPVSIKACASYLFLQRFFSKLLKRILDIITS